MISGPFDVRDLPNDLSAMSLKVYGQKFNGHQSVLLIHDGNHRGEYYPLDEEVIEEELSIATEMLKQPRHNPTARKRRLGR